MLEIFFRDDDADRDCPELRRLLGVFAAAGAPLDLAVIPGSVDSACARLLLSRGGAVEVHQHGWMHTNHETTGRKSEFGPARARAQQQADIAAGQRRMTEVFGDRWAPIFTPPWNRCTADTHAALRELGFAAVSQDVGALRVLSDLQQLPIHVDIFRWKNGPQLKPLAQIEAELDAAARPTGLLLHHKVMDSSAFKLLESLLRNLRSARFVRMSRLVGAACPN